MAHGADRALVAGATGMVGRPLCEQLVAEGWSVTALARFGNIAARESLEALEALGVKTIRFDVTADDPAVLPDVDVLFLQVWDRAHLHGPVDVAALWKLNYEGIGRLATRYGSSSIVNGSTISLYGPRGDRPSCEEDTPRPDSDYALSRFAQERLIDFLCLRAGGRSVHLRYGHANTAERGVIRRTAEAVWAGASLGADPDRKIQVIGLTDFVRCARLAGRAITSVASTINVVHPRVWTLRELATTLLEALGDGRVVFDREAGGSETSVWAEPKRMLEQFGTPLEDLDGLIGNVAAEVRASRGQEPNG